MRKNIQKLFFIFAAFLLPFSVYAAPSISGTSGTFNHGSSVTISGSGFGTKATATPLVWDDMSGTDITSLWTVGGTNMGYHLPMRSVPLPHSHITKYAAGSHASALDVYLSRTVVPTSYPFTVYFSGYRRDDPNWTFCDDNNYKDLIVTHGTSPADGDFWYSQAINKSSSSNASNWTPLNLGLNDSSGCLTNPDANGHSMYYWWDNSSDANQFDGWVKDEYEIRFTDQNTGWVKEWRNGVLLVDYYGHTDAYGLDNNHNIAMGVYFRSGCDESNNYRYFADMYFDTSAQRVIICNGSTWSSRGLCEVQIPSSWSANSITATVNQAAFADAATKYLYVVDNAGTANTNGQSITFGSGSSDTVPPASPSGLSVS